MIRSLSCIGLFHQSSRSDPSSVPLYTKKRALCAFDEKRYLLEDGIIALAFGDNDIRRVIDIEDDPQDVVVMSRGMR